MKNIGVVIGRFQVDKLHSGHTHLIEYVMQKCTNLLILIGTRPTSNATARDPLDYETRREMVAKAYPAATIMPVLDKPSNNAWSTDIDRCIQKCFPGQPARLYGSRDSFIPQYNGIWPVIEVPMAQAPTGCSVRNKLKGEPCQSRAERRGMIKAALQRFPTSYQVIDMAVIKKENDMPTHILLGRKNEETGLRLIGGFVDPTDDCLETAAVRELCEEVGEIKVKNITYVRSARVQDVRYHNQPDQIMTVVFIADYIEGEIDLSSRNELIHADWYPINTLRHGIIETHKHLAKYILHHISK